jgi:endonuclease/exonuclease/phosphatase (EEP) superfamily protein YafD
LNTKLDDISEITDLDPELVLVKPEPKVPEPRKRQRNIEWGGAFIGFLLAAGGIVAGRLGHIWPAFDVFAQFTAQFFVALAAFSLALILPRRKGFIGLLLSVLGCLGYGIWALSHGGPIGKGPWDLNPGEKAVRFAHFNTYQNNHDLAAQEKEIARLDADVLTLIEFTAEKMPILDHLRVQYPYQFDCNAMPACNLAIISKVPFAAVDAKALWEGPPMITARMGGPLSGLTVMGIHTTRFPHSRAQLRQVSALVKALESESGKLVMMGDFNATPFSRVTSTLANGLGLNRLSNVPSWPAAFGMPQLAIDHVFASRDIRVLGEEQIGEPSGSDHYPIVMTLGVDLQ